ncbi:hypothetical protein D3A96_03480 [Robertkochia marina]|nr:hypothetical protein D3A96_03480 [Robertkochia marina]
MGYGVRVTGYGFQLYVFAKDRALRKQPEAVFSEGASWRTGKGRPWQSPSYTSMPFFRFLSQKPILETLLIPSFFKED